MTGYLAILVFFGGFAHRYAFARECRANVFKSIVDGVSWPFFVGVALSHWATRLQVNLEARDDGPV